VRKFSWPLILFQLIWLNVILPGHTRGLVTIGQSCEAKTGGCCSHKPADPASKAPTPDQQKRCAVCAFAAALSTPPAIDLSLDFIGIGRPIVLDRPASASALDLPSANRERAPPAMTA
jgi:hypothetical protein